jgi:hypothetical protein
VALTAKQRRFAYSVAAGTPKKAAYSQIYSNRGNANTLAKNAHVLAKNPAVAAAIAEYESRLISSSELRAKK